MSKCQAKDCQREVEQYKYCSVECSIYGEKEMLMKEFHYSCDCFAIEDTLRFCFMEDDDYPELWVEIYLDKKPFWKRVWYGLRYICGYQSAYGAFGNWTMRLEDCQRLKEMVDKFETECKKSKRINTFKKKDNDE